MVKLPKSFKLDIACGQTKPEGWIGVDIAGENVDVFHDLEVYPWPFKDESVEEARASHYFEHTKDAMKFMDEVYRILKPGAQFHIICPYYNSMRCWQDPTHTRAVSEASFLYFNAEWRKTNKLDHYPVKCDFDFQYGYSFYPEWANRSDESRQFAIKHYMNVVSDIHVTLTKRG
jgi:SAM-dependent methyltransferase